ncbi:MAG: hypothetical protein R2828_21750 [Saprospiraceae bacterium]
MSDKSGYNIADPFGTYFLTFTNQPKELFYAKFALQKVNYIHYNPVKAGIVDQPEAYVHSSARNYVGRTDVLLSVELLDFGLG